MSSGNISRYKNLGSYLSNINARLAQSERNRSAYGGIAAGAITSNHLTGQVVLDDNIIQSANYAKGVSGWSIDANGSAEFSDVFVRGNINADSGTIGVWNLSAQETSRTFDIETYSASGAVTDVDATTGAYLDTVTYTFTGVHSLIIGDFVTITGITSEDNTSATNGLGFNIINAEIKSVTSTTATVYSTVRDTYTSGTGLVSKIYAGTFIENVDLGFDDSNATSGTYVGLYTSENLKTSGLYIRDYEKRYLDYGYFSSNGVAYTSAAVLNLIWNPSAEYFSSTANTVTNTVTGWASTSGTPVNTYDFIGSQAANNGTDAIQRMFTAYSAYGIIAGWDTTARTDYTTATIDYKAGDNYNLFDRTKPIYLDFDLYPMYQPVVTNVTSLTWWSNTVVKINGTNTFAAGEGIYFDFVAYNNGASLANLFEPGAVSTVASSPAPTSSAFWINIPYGYSPQTGYNNAVSTVAKTYTLGVSTLAFTVSTMSLTFTAGQGVQIVVPSGTLAGTYYGTIAASPTPTNTTFTVTWTIAPSASGTLPIGTTFTGDPIGILDNLHGGSTYQVYKKTDWYLNPAEIKLQFDSSNALTMTSLSNVVSSGVTFTPEAYKIDGQAFLSNYVNNKPSFAKTISISLDPSKISSEYLRLASDNYANANTITLNMPNWLYKDSAYTTKWVKSSSDYVSANITGVTSTTSGTTYTVSNQFRLGQIVSISGVHTTAPDSGQFNVKDVQVINFTGSIGNASSFTVATGYISGTGTTPWTGTAVGRIGYVLDNVSLSPENRFFYGSSGLNSSTSPYSWYSLGSGTTAPAQASLEAPKSWINVDLLGQTAVLNYWDYIGFKTSSTGYSGNMFSTPSISTVPSYSDFNFYSNSNLGNYSGYMIAANTSSVLNLSGGIIEWDTGGAAFEKYESYINSVVSKSAAGVEMVAKRSVGAGGSFDNLFGELASASVYVDDFGGDSGSVAGGGGGVFNVVADLFRVTNSNNQPTLNGNFVYNNISSPYTTNQILQVSANAQVTTTATSATSSPSPTLDGNFWTPASGMSVINFSAWMSSNNSAGNAYGSYAIYQGTNLLGTLVLASGTNSDISGAILVQGTNYTSVSSSYVFVGEPNTQYYIVGYFYTNATYTATISRRRITVTPLI